MSKLSAIHEETTKNPLSLIFFVLFYLFFFFLVVFCPKLDCRLVVPRFHGLRINPYRANAGQQIENEGHGRRGLVLYKERAGDIKTCHLPSDHTTTPVFNQRPRLLHPL